MLFINKMDVSSRQRARDDGRAAGRLGAAAGAAPGARSAAHGKDGGEVTGYVDLVSERAYKYHPGQESDLIKMPEEVLPREQEARSKMLESLADFDDHADGGNPQ